MKSLLFVTLIALSTGLLRGQTITGKVFDAATNEALAYVNIGVMSQPRGTITGEDGAFALETAGLSAEVTVRFSMIGYVAQTFTIQELSDNKIIKLENVSVQLSEVVINPKKFGKPKKVGVTKFTKKFSVCGWGGDGFGQGHEIGTKISLGSSPVYIKSMHILILQSYDSSLFRVHIRKIENELPGEEVLDKNILIAVTEKNGWGEIDLSQYGLICQGDIVLSLEWVKVIGINKDRLLYMNREKQATANILFRRLKGQCCTYSRRGSEAPWVRHDDGAPCFYLIVR